MSLAAIIHVPSHVRERLYEYTDKVDWESLPYLSSKCIDAHLCDTAAKKDGVDARCLKGVVVKLKQTRCSRC